MNMATREWRAIALFFAGAYAPSWSAWLILFRQGLSHLEGAGFNLYLVAVFAPHLAAVLVAGLEGGVSGMREFYRTVFRRLPALWIVVAIAAPVAIYFAGYLLGAAFEQGGAAPVFHAPSRPLFILLFGQTAVALGEEPGWRGFALARLTRRLGIIAGSVLLGIGWAAWHLPLFLIKGTVQYGTSFFAFLVLLVAWSLIVTYLVRNSRGSVIAAMLFHASANICDFTMWGPRSSLLMILPWLVAAAFAVWRLRHDGSTLAIKRDA